MLLVVWLSAIAGSDQQPRSVHHHCCPGAYTGRLVFDTFHSFDTITYPFGRSREAAAWTIQRSTERRHDWGSGEPAIALGSSDRTHHMIVCAQNRPPGDVPQCSSPTRASAHRHHKAPSFRHFRNVLSREIGFELRQLSWSTQRSVCDSNVGLVNADPEGIAVMLG